MKQTCPYTLGFLLLMFTYKKWKKFEICYMKRFSRLSYMYFLYFCLLHSRQTAIFWDQWDDHPPKPLSCIITGGPAPILRSVRASIRMVGETPVKSLKHGWCAAPPPPHPRCSKAVSLHFRFQDGGLLERGRIGIINLNVAVFSSCSRTILKYNFRFTTKY
jgi:hypothetical protein